jgi:hypothetical protein
MVHRATNDTPILDIHTHAYSSRFGSLLLYGLDELLTYHYLVAEVSRIAPLPYERFWQMGKTDQADYIWKHLFIDHSPISEACRGVLTVLQAFGVDRRQKDLTAVRKQLSSIRRDAYIDQVFKLANVRAVIMTNDPFDDLERPVWEQGPEQDSRFQAALRIDPLLNDWPKAAGRLAGWGYDVDGNLGQRDIGEVRRFLADWVKRMSPRYMAVSLTPDFRFPDAGPAGSLIEKCILPACREAGIPFALMIGVRRQLNPGLRLAGDGVGPADVASVSRLCSAHPDNRFLVTMLARENQHELCVTARKHPNLLVFGCWWFLNNPSLIEEMTRMRFELLGTSVVPQHSDARVLDQIIYKWSHSRRIIADVLADKYIDLAWAGWTPTEQEIRRDVTDLFGGNFERFCG